MHLDGTGSYMLFSVVFPKSRGVHWKSSTYFSKLLGNVIHSGAMLLHLGQTLRYRRRTVAMSNLSSSASSEQVVAGIVTIYRPVAHLHVWYVGGCMLARAAFSITSKASRIVDHIPATVETEQRECSNCDCDIHSG